MCKGTILEAVRAKPKRLSFGQLSRTETPPKKTVVITRGDGGPLKLKLKPFTAEGITAELREIEPGEKYELEVALAPPYGPRGARANLKFDTGVAEAPTTEILVYGSVRPRVTPSPRRFSVPMERDSDWEESVSLTWDDASTHKILSATVNNPDATVEVREEDGEQRVFLKVNQSFVKRAGANTVTITTDDAIAPSVKVPIAVRRSPRSMPAKRPAIIGKAQEANTKEPNAGKTKTEAARPKKAKPAPSTSG